jgi:hypothetical protein
MRKHVPTMQDQLQQYRVGFASGLRSALAVPATPASGESAGLFLSRTFWLAGLCSVAFWVALAVLA